MEQIHQHEWDRKYQWFYKCPHCECVKIVSDLGATSYIPKGHPQDRTSLTEEPACIPIPGTGGRKVMRDLYYIKKQGAYYGPMNCGYVSSFINAGIYSKEAAQKECDNCSYVSMIKVDVDKHNEQIDSQIKDLQRLKIFKY